MTFSSKNIKALLMSVGVSIIICVAQLLNIRIFILGGLGLFMLLMVWVTLKDMALPALLYFLPWSPLLKLAPGSMTFYTFALILVCAITFFKHGFRFNRIILALFIVLLGVTMISKIIEGYSIDNSYIMFMLLLLLFPLLAGEDRGSYDFYMVTLFFSAGIIVAALSSQQLLSYSGISRYVNVFSVNDITRHSGYYVDPNFYSAHITVALSGVLILLTDMKKKSKVYLLILTAVVLLYCGFLSASKTFLLIVLLSAAIWVLHILFMRGKISSKITLFVTLLFIAAFILYSSIFSESLDVIIKRFGQANDMDDLTTGRTDLWVMYLRSIFGDIKNLFLGKGFTISEKIASSGSHNTGIQMLFQLGLVGMSLFLTWVGFFAKRVLRNDINLKGNFTGILTLLVGAFGMWFSIDLMFFDELFLIPFYVFIGINWLSSTNNKKELKREDTHLNKTA